MVISNKHVFWQALLSAALIFGVGLLIGLWIENYRSQSVENTLLYSEINLLDAELLGEVGGIFSLDCESSRENVMLLADKVYNEARKLEKYDDSSQLTDVLEVLHRRYDLLRVVLWKESVSLRERCGDDFHTVVYIYQYKEPTIRLKSEQVTFSKFLEEQKEKYGNEIILIPIAGDLDLESVNAIKRNFNISSYPVVIADEKVALRSLDELIGMEKYLE